MEAILSQARKVAEAAEVFTVSTEETSVQFETNRLKHIQSKQASVLSLRIIRQGRVGYASTTGQSNGQDLVNMAVETAQFGMSAGFQFPSVPSYPDVVVFDHDVAPTPIEQMVETGAGLISVITGHTPEVICEAAVTKGVVSFSIINSRGGEATYSKSYYGVAVEGSLIRGTDMLFVGDSESSCHPIQQSKAIGEAVVRQLELARDNASIATRMLPVIFTPKGVADALMPPLISAFNGKMVLEGASPLGKRLGERVFDGQLSLWDDPTLAYRPASRPCDDEGVPSQRTPLIEQGMVAHFLYDLQTAARAHTQSTGNGSRGQSGLPSPSASALIVAPGSATFDEMVSDIKEGLIIEQLIGAGQGNILGGDFGGNVLLGYKIESGKIVGRVKDTMISGNVYQALKQIAAIGSDAQWVGGFLQTPHIYCSSLSVASK